MYEAFYGLKEKPFSLLPDPDFLFLSRKHSLALNMLEYSLAGQAGFCAITGEIGSGKTTLIRTLLRRVDRDISIGLISNTHSSHFDIASWALAAFGQPVGAISNAELHRELTMFLIGEYAAGKRCVLIVDEAQNLTIEALEELRLLSNINADKDLLLQIILVGQPQLLEKLRRPELSQFAQRISVSYHLAPLTCAETLHYVAHRLNVAGAADLIFNDVAIGGIHYFAGGVPRLINSICDMALVYGYAEQRPSIDLDIIFRVIGDRMASGMSAFPGDGDPNDPKVVRDITSFVKEANMAHADLPAFASSVPQPKKIEKVVSSIRPALTVETDGIYASPRSVVQDQDARPSWFKRAFRSAQ
jgi:type II secretory pathway predicted ATPase ExeA